MKGTFLAIKFALMYGLEVGVIAITLTALLIGLAQVVRHRLERAAEDSISDRTPRAVEVRREV